MIIKNFFNNYKPKWGAAERNSNGTIIYEDKYRGNIWKEYLEQLQEGPELTGQEIKHEEVMGNRLTYSVMREEFDKALEI